MKTDVYLTAFIDLDRGHDADVRPVRAENETPAQTTAIIDMNGMSIHVRSLAEWEALTKLVARAGEILSEAALLKTRPAQVEA